MARQAPDPWKKMGLKSSAPGRGLKTSLARLDPAFREEEEPPKKIYEEKDKSTKDSVGKTKICRVCKKEFIPEKSYYHTCPSCFKSC